TSVSSHQEMPSTPPPAPVSRYSVGAPAPAARITRLVTTLSIAGEYTSICETRGPIGDSATTRVPAGAAAAGPETTTEAATAQTMTANSFTAFTLPLYRAGAGRSRPTRREPGSASLPFAAFEVQDSRMHQGGRGFTGITAVGSEHRRRGQTRRIDRAQRGRRIQRQPRFGVAGGEHETPVAETRHIHVIGQ